MFYETPYHEAIALIERLQRRFFDVLKVELDKKEILDINPVQAMMLYKIGDDQMTVGELTLRGYYIGSNVSYNVKELQKTENLEKTQSPHDKRSYRIKVSDKGQEICKLISDMLSAHGKKMHPFNLDMPEIDDVNLSLRSLEEFWAAESKFTGLSSLDDDDGLLG